MQQRCDLDGLVQTYRIYAQSEGKSEATIVWVSNAVRYLRQFLESTAMITDIAEIGAEQLRLFTLYLQNCRRFASHPFTKPQEGRLSKQTINDYLRALRAFWSWAVGEGIIEASPFNGMKIPKALRKVIPTFSAEEFARLIESTDVANPQGCRDRAIMLTFYDTFLRVSELAKLQLDDVNLERRTIRVFGKGAKERVVPFGVRVHKALLRYLNFHRPEPATPQIKQFFLTHAGQPMQRRRIQAIIRRCGDKAGIKGIRCSPHTLRHTAAVTWIRNGGDVFSLQQMLGHSTLDMVRIYVNLALSDVEAAHRRYSPADNLDLNEPGTKRFK